MISRRVGYLLAAVGLLAFAGCGGTSALPQANTMPGGQSSGSAAVLGVAGETIQVSSDGVGVRLTGESSFSSQKYGVVLGYFRGVMSTVSQVVDLTADTTVIFRNVDSSLPHTASFLGDASKNSASFPAHFDGSATQAPKGTTINTSMFSTGPMSPGTHSLKYNTGSPGFYMFGCAFHYDSHGMRTVMVVK